MSDENKFYFGACLKHVLDVCSAVYFFLFFDQNIFYCLCMSYGFISIEFINFFFPFSSFDYKIPHL